ncbi:hypothetical protein [Aquimarina sp. 2304DJ70-9]|uniref:hypothetical protein n=1 Tax=Aquimarina penaris TaxID=3231044 RepID=UPI0034633031
MKTIKVIWSLILLFTVISCSTDDIKIEELQNNQTLFEQKNFLSDQEGLAYGMPLLPPHSYINENNLIKVTYNTENPSTIIAVRQEFSEKYSTLRLVKPLSFDSNVEHWVLKNVINSGGGTQSFPDDDRDLNQEDQYTTLIRDIRAHELVNLLGETYPPLGLDTTLGSPRR